jgi:hypothetical protein
MGDYFEEVLGIGAGEVCYRAERSFVPKFPVREGRYVAHMNTSADDDAAFVNGTQGGWDQGASRSENYGSVELGWGRPIGIASPNRTETAGKCLGAFIPGAGKCKDLALLKVRNLRNNVGSGAKSVNPETPSIASLAQSAIANQSSTEERSRGDIVKGIGKTVAKLSMCEGEFGVTPIQRVARKASLLTEIFPIRSAILALTTGPSQPRNSDAVTVLESLHGLAKLLNPADDFVARNQGKFRIRQLAIDHVQIGSAYGTRSDAHDHFFRTGISDRHRASDKRSTRGLEDHCVHGSFLAQKAQDGNTSSLFR